MRHTIDHRRYRPLVIQVREEDELLVDELAVRNPLRLLTIQIILT